MLIEGYFLLFILAFLLGGIAAVRKDRRFLVMSGGVLFLMGGLVGATGIEVHSGWEKTGTINQTAGPDNSTLRTFNITRTKTVTDVSSGEMFADVGLNTILLILFIFAGLLAIMVGVFVPGSAYEGPGVMG